MECCAKAITAWIVGKSEPILIFRRDLIDMELLMGYYQASNCTTDAHHRNIDA